MGFSEILEISKPRIVVLLVITAVTSMYAGSKFVGPELDMWGLLHIIIAGALASAGSSALNHYYDRDIDPKMKRTSTRPIPSGNLAPNHALIYGLAVSCASVIYAYFTLNVMSTFFIALGIFFYVIIYTVWLKRLNTSNIVIGGFAGSAASMAGWAAATGSMDLLGFLIGFLVFVWTPSHFWCLAMKIKDDYEEAGVPMLPVVIGMQKTSKYILGNTLILLPYSLMLYAFGLGLVYTVIAAVSGGLMLAYHYKLTKNPTSDFAWKAYKVTAPYLTIIFLAVALDAAFHFRI
ncbi:protoheme IX farnesyltransferase [Nitrosopumilus sp. b1]|uniref:heme o synthase n=1 Tax=Nitrosopumilus sp. b1 TaxID=2109907 RepID=UPI000E2CB35B|nr:heme o synthase [Nitrosopumilus sp. b1]RDJ32769.1 MAG: protoheme IX farnesyltransferase [Thermoproteota archaeon]KAF6243682.1 protoheme IX farnesyltransferase [Nitrosopumilus sp. b1]RDJ33424.1 MAG: protoheme IX farnesyltransferase [Thermoproteota archaeon]RDJ36052.1 MAG: protoheme IX farnesyltransferase [Thermoproteota archaeon]RDJ38380.1 MAG: protoheme IX farnesyltransferase [Thermoproteota archaeon]